MRKTVKILGLFALAWLLGDWCAAHLYGQSVIAGPGLMQGGGPTILSPCPAEVSVTNLVGCWAFEDGSGDVIRDGIGGNDGQVGSTSGSDNHDFTWSSAGADFDGAASPNNDYATIPFILNPTSNFTLTVVFRSDASAANRMIFTQQDGTGTGRPWLWLISTDVLQSVLGNAALGSQTATDNVWHTGTLRHNSGTVSVILDAGTAVSGSRTVESATGQYVVGTHKDTAQNPFNGEMAFIILYDAALSDATVGTNRTALVAYLAGRGISF